jgi:hypothetical protein
MCDESIGVMVLWKKSGVFISYDNKYDTTTNLRMLCMLCTPMPETQKDNISAVPTATPANIAQYTPDMSYDTVSSMPSLQIKKANKTLPTMAAMNCKMTPPSTG